MTLAAPFDREVLDALAHRLRRHPVRDVRIVACSRPPQRSETPERSLPGARVS